MPLGLAAAGVVAAGGAAGTLGLFSGLPRLHLAPPAQRLARPSLPPPAAGQGSSGSPFVVGAPLGQPLPPPPRRRRPAPAPLVLPPLATAPSSGGAVGTRVTSALREAGHRPFAYPAQRLHANGTLESHARLMRRELVEELGLKPRDIVLLFSKDGRLSFDLNVRNASVLLSLGRDGPAVIVGRGSAWVIPRGGPVQNMGKHVQRRFLEVVQMTHTSSEGDHVRRPGHEEEYFQESLGRASGAAPPAEGAGAVEPTTAMLDSVPFGIAVTEALLVMFLERLRISLQRATAEGAALLNSFASTGSAEISAFKLEVLRRTKQRLDYLRGQAKGLQQTLLEAIGDEDDMSLLASAVGVTSEEWELCFEYYSHGAEEVGLEAERQVEGLEDLERSISLRLSSRRLELEKLQIYLDVLGNGLSLGAVLTGAFGMNLLSGLESRPRTFWPAFSGIAAASALMSFGLNRLVRRRLHNNGGTTAVWVTRGRQQSEGSVAAPPRPSSVAPPRPSGTDAAGARVPDAADPW